MHGPRRVRARIRFTAPAAPSITGALVPVAVRATAPDDREDRTLSRGPPAGHAVPGGRSRRRRGELPHAGRNPAHGRDLLRGEGQPGPPDHRASRPSGLQFRHCQHLRDRAVPGAGHRAPADGLWQHDQEGTRHPHGAWLRRPPVRFRQRGRARQARARGPRRPGAVPHRDGGGRRRLAVVGEVRLPCRHGARSARTGARDRARFPVDCPSMSARSSAMSGNGMSPSGGRR